MERQITTADSPAGVTYEGAATGELNHTTATSVAHRHSCSMLEMPDRRSEMAQTYL